MGFQTETGYALPGGDLDLTHARILHKGNEQRIKEVTASAEIAGFPKEAANNGLTYERWMPFANQMTDPADLGETTWTPVRFTVGADGQTLDEGTDAATNRTIAHSFTFTAVEWVISVQVERQSMEGIRLNADDGTTTHAANFDLHNETVDLVSNCLADIVDLGDDIFELRIYFTPAAATGTFYLVGYDGTTTIYTGDNSTIRILRVAAHPSSAWLRFDSYAAAEADLIGIAAHNLFSAAGRVAIEHDSNNDGTFTTIETITPTDDSPIMLLFAGITSARWRLTVDRAVLPEIGVFRIGKALQMERPIHMGFRPFETNRATISRGNVSEAGQFLGRSTIRSALRGSISWSPLSPTWVAANLAGPSGLIQSVENEPIFLAWRPGTYPQAYYAWTTATPAGPSFSQRPKYQAFSMALQALGFE